MPLRARKSIRIAKGVRLNLSKTGVGVSVGTRGLRYSVHSSGRRTVSAGLRGTGLGYQESWKVGSGPTVSAPGMSGRAPRPGLFAAAHEKAFYRALQAYARGDLPGAVALFKASSERDSAGRAASDDLLAGLLSVQVGDVAGGVPLLEKVVASEHELPDALMAKYVAEAAIVLHVTDNVSVDLPFGSAAAALILAHCYRDMGRAEE